jgi:hypothetical protein
MRSSRWLTFPSTDLWRPEICKVLSGHLWSAAIQLAACFNDLRQHEWIDTSTAHRRKGAIIIVPARIPAHVSSVSRPATVVRCRVNALRRLRVGRLRSAEWSR